MLFRSTRRLLINGAEKQLTWNWDDNAIRIFHPAKNEWEVITYDVLDAAGGYNKNITEQMYIDEMQTFFKAIEGNFTFVNTLDSDHRVLRLLYAAEESFRTKQFVQTI